MFNVEDLKEEIRSEGMYHYSPSLFLAKVISPFPNIQVQFEDLIFKKEQIKISGTRFFFDIHKTTTDISKSSIEHNHIIKKEGLKLKNGDLLLVYINKLDNNIIIIDKVVDI